MSTIIIYVKLVSGLLNGLNGTVLATWANLQRSVYDGNDFSGGYVWGCCAQSRRFLKTFSQRVEVIDTKLFAFD